MFSQLITWCVYIKRNWLTWTFSVLSQAFYAVSNFKPAQDCIPVPAPPPPKDALRALAQRGHDSVYNKGHASESNEEITSPSSLDGLNRPIQREKASLGSLKRASVDVELLAPRSPMGKETMVTFSNTLPRATAAGPEEPTRRLVTVPVPVDPMRSHQLVSEWKQKSLEMRSASLQSDEGSKEDSDLGEDTTEEESAPSTLYSTTVPQSAKPSNAPTGARVVMPPKPPVPPPVSPKSASTRAKWLSITEKSGANIPGVLRVTNQPRIMQVIAMSKQQGLLSSTKSSEASSSSATSSITGTESPPYRPPSERDSGSGIITVDAHASHHPVVHMVSNPANPWEWRGSSNGNMSDSYELNDLNREGSRGYRQVKNSSPCSSTGEADPDSRKPFQNPQPPQPPQLPKLDQNMEGRSLRCKTPLVLIDRENPHNHQENFYKKLQSGRRFKEWQGTTSRSTNDAGWTHITMHHSDFHSHFCAFSFLVLMTLLTSEGKYLHGLMRNISQKKKNAASANTMSTIFLVISLDWNGTKT